MSSTVLWHGQPQVATAIMAINVQGKHVCMLAYLPTIVALSTGVPQRVVGDVRVLIQEHLKLACADAQVILIELIRDVPAYGTKLPTFLQVCKLRSASLAHISCRAT